MLYQSLGLMPHGPQETTGGGALMKDQLINSIAVNWVNI